MSEREVGYWPQHQLIGQAEVPADADRPRQAVPVDRELMRLGAVAYDEGRVIARITCRAFQIEWEVPADCESHAQRCLAEARVAGARILNSNRAGGHVRGERVAHQGEDAVGLFFQVSVSGAKLLSMRSGYPQ